LATEALMKYVLTGWLDRVSQEDYPGAQALLDDARPLSRNNSAMVCERRDPDALSAAQRDQIAQRLEQERTERLARRYLRDLRKQAFVEVRI
jgi:hypothetical protein